MGNEQLADLTEYAASSVPDVDAEAPRTSASRSTNRSQPAEEGAREELHLTDYVKVLYRRRWTAATVFGVILLAVSAYTFTATPLYSARVQILIEKENTNVVTFKEAFEQNQVTDDYYQTQYKILQSRALARRTIDALKLWNDPRLNPPEQRFSLRNLLRAPIVFVKSRLAPAADKPASSAETEAESRTIDRFLGSLTITPVRNSRLVDVNFRSSDPSLAASIATALATQFIEQNREIKITASKEASDWLNKRLEEQRQRVEASEQALQRYREQTDSVSLEDRQNIVIQKLADLNAAVTKAKTDRIQKEAAYRQIQAVNGNPGRLDTISAILSNTFIQQQKAEIADLQRQQAQLSERLGPNHPDMRKVTTAIQSAEMKLTGEVAKVVQAMKNDYEAALLQEHTLTNALEQQKQQALELNRKGIDYGALQRDATTNRQIFESLLQRAKETGIASELKRSNISIVDTAEIPRYPSSPNTLGNLLGATFGGAFLAVGLVFFLEYLDNRLKAQEEITHHLGLSDLGMIPELFDVGKSNPLMNNGVPAGFAESFRALRTNLFFSSPTEGRHSVVVTSTGPSEGKTVVACNLAIALAQSGQRVLLVDADMRRPRVHQLFGHKREPGLSEVLIGTFKTSQSIRQGGVSGLWVLPAGATPRNPAELLSSKRYQELQERLEQNFDWIVVDVPPVMAVTDASIVAHLSSTVLFVVGAEMTRRRAAKTALDQLSRARASVVGALLNKVDLKHQGYYYAEYCCWDYYEDQKDQKKDQKRRRA